ncbi:MULTISPECIES: trimeric intracellular cation channel family protein [Actinomadura]|uniref:Trimeric intracellular cation channel family protein n=1 Tax=Actinomadura litoris TaxID=2678616 RepID=A0A7K1L079_9ACTN|nr:MULTISPECIES: trimeric intracellular cation channel family protein [Actinomadura]MBT2211768.1 trimeric intracellular cation channel family protein [Actinomadura sp. NEAU-AAG7]MUN37737.1 trimeric intracellular cation channel family protein [Actinomadura litoris]
MAGPGVPEVLDLAGIFVFAVSGGLAAVRQRLDVVGMVVLAEITALGGGILRDLLIGAVPPAAFTSLGYVLVPLAASALVFFWHPQVTRLLPAVLLFDAAGLGLFCATGTLKALEHGLSPLHSVLLGVVTAVGGGVLRDMLGGQIPSVLYDRQLYALPAMLGAAVMAVAYTADLHGGAVTAGAAVLATGLRLLAIRYGWRTPRPRGVPD